MGGGIPPWKPKNSQWPTSHTGGIPWWREILLLIPVSGHEISGDSWDSKTTITRGMTRSPSSRWVWWLWILDLLQGGLFPYDDWLSVWILKWGRKLIEWPYKSYKLHIKMRISLRFWKHPKDMFIVYKMYNRFFRSASDPSHLKSHLATHPQTPTWPSPVPVNRTGLESWPKHLANLVAIEAGKALLSLHTIKLTTELLPETRISARQQQPPAEETHGVEVFFFSADPDEVVSCKMDIWLNVN